MKMSQISIALDGLTYGVAVAVVVVAHLNVKVKLKKDYDQKRCSTK